MSLRRDLSGLALFLVMSGSLTASEPAKRLEVKWSELGGMIGGARVTLQNAERVKCVRRAMNDSRSGREPECPAALLCPRNQ